MSVIVLPQRRAWSHHSLALGGLALLLLATAVLGMSSGAMQLGVGEIGRAHV